MPFILSFHQQTPSQGPYIRNLIASAWKSIAPVTVVSNWWPSPFKKKVPSAKNLLQVLMRWALASHIHGARLLKLPNVSVRCSVHHLITKIPTNLIGFTHRKRQILMLGFYEYHYLSLDYCIGWLAVAPTIASFLLDWNHVGEEEEGLIPLCWETITFIPCLS